MTDTTTLGIEFPNVLLPAQGIDYHKWAVIACDQYTSEPDYWRRVEEIVGDAPSTLRLILPEVYLGSPDMDARLSQIAETTEQYLAKGILSETEAAPILVSRTTGSGRRRNGLLLSFDLEQYDFGHGAKPLIRPTEETIVERLPPRARIRRAAAAEFPHILVLVDDRARRIIQPLFEHRDTLEKRYETELMLGGGSVSGYAVTNTKTQRELLDALAACRGEAMERDPDAPFLYAVGDGNHSLATAKRVWEERKASGATSDDPSRFALAELIDIYDPGLVFEPIHRLVAGRPAGELLDFIADRTGSTVHRGAPETARSVRWVTSEESGTLEVPGSDLPGVPVQRALEAIPESDVWIDYIHGDESLNELIHAHLGLGILMPPVPKSEFFSLVRTRGVLPRKMFSLGEASEKRYYVEGRRITRS